MLRVVTAVLFICFLCGVAVLDSSGQSTSAQLSPGTTPGPAQTLYLKLRSVGLDKAHVYKIREATLDRAKLHFSFDDGTIAFTEAVDGRITGAFFVGYGEVLLIPPDSTERESVSLFTGGAILEETFSSAYLRFNDDVLAELGAYLRPADDPAGFVAQWNRTAQDLASDDALRLLLSFSNSIGDEKSAGPTAGDRMLHAYVEGNKLGGFDLRYDSLLQEQVEVGQTRHLNGEDFYDVWTSFAVPAVQRSTDSTIRDPDETPNAELDVTAFKIQAHVRPTKDLEARATLDVTARQRSRRAILFELSRMLRVSTVTANGRPVEFIHNQAVEGSHLAKEGNDVIAVILPAPLEKGEKIQLIFEYSGQVLSEAANGLLYVGDRGTWYPNVGFAMADFNLEFDYPAGWTLVATGHQTTSRTAAGEQISTWTTERPVPVAGFNLGKYSQAVSRAGKVTVTTYATPNVERGFPGTESVAQSLPPILPDPRVGLHGLPTIPLTPPPPAPSPSSNAQSVGATSARAIEFYERHFGPYPYDELSITQMPGPISQGWPGLIFLSSYSFLTPQEMSKVEPNPVRQLMWEQVVAHETAHQWWGDLVSWDSYRDQWIMEALANYSALMLLQSHDPVKFQEIMQTYRDDLLAKNDKGLPLMDAGPVTLGFRLNSSQFVNAYEPICYGRGTWLLHMLRMMMRGPEAKTANETSAGLDEEPFMRALRKLRKEYATKSVSTAELMHVFESELPESSWYDGQRSLDWFYESWVNGKSIPNFELRDVKFTEKGKTTFVSGTIIQDQAPDTFVTLVPLYALVGGRDVFIKRVFAEGKETQFHLVAPAGARKLLIDPERTLLSRAKY